MDVSNKSSILYLFFTIYLCLLRLHSVDGVVQLLTRTKLKSVSAETSFFSNMKYVFYVPSGFPECPCLSRM